ncbi:MAG TPA: hypothetical protein VHP33_02955 [Polyangiaceae bacterium]|nr:hypothetical protein [Polyangiaceae bacterium]
MSNKPVRPSQPSFSDIEPGSKVQPPPSAGMRGIIDALLQGSLVELFQAYGVAIAPLPRDVRAEPERYPELSALIGFSAASDGKCASANGRLSLSMPPEVVDVMQASRSLQVRHADWSRELVNQLMGRFKNRLLPFGAKLQAGLPSSIGREALEAQMARAANRRVYRARTLRGEIVATLEGTLNEAELSYTAPISAPAEGEMILF